MYVKRYTAVLSHLRHIIKENDMLNYSKYIIDAHAHIFPDKIAVKAADNIGRFYDLYMNFDGTTDTLIKQGDECGVSKFVVQSVATVPHQVKRINDFIVSAVQKYPDRLIGFGSLHPDMNGMEEEIDRLISIGLHGIKLHPDFQKFAINDENACRIYDAVGDRLPFLIHTGDKRYKYSNPSLMAEIAKNIRTPALLPHISAAGRSGKRRSRSLWDLIIYG